MNYRNWVWYWQPIPYTFLIKVVFNIYILSIPVTCNYVNKYDEIWYIPKFAQKLLKSCLFVKKNALSLTISNPVVYVFWLEQEGGNDGNPHQDISSQMPCKLDIWPTDLKPSRDFPVVMTILKCMHAFVMYPYWLNYLWFLGFLGDCYQEIILYDLFDPLNSKPI